MGDARGASAQQGNGDDVKTQRRDWVMLHHITRSNAGVPKTFALIDRFFRININRRRSCSAPCLNLDKYDFIRIKVMGDDVRLAFATAVLPLDYLESPLLKIRASERLSEITKLLGCKRFDELREIIAALKGFFRDAP